MAFATPPPLRTPHSSRSRPRRRQRSAMAPSAPPRGGAVAAMLPPASAYVAMPPVGAALAAADYPGVQAVAFDPSVQALDPTTTVVVFVLGLVPFVWAAVEFWRRIAVGEPFGTGKDSIIISDEEGVEGSRFGSRPVLGKGAIYLARGLMVVAFGTVALSVGAVVFGSH